MATRPSTSSESGFSLLELLVATCIFLIITGIVASALKQMSDAQATIWNRTQMHSGVRGATELLQQEVGQAGRLSTPQAILTSNAIPAAASCDPTSPGLNAATVQVNSVAGLWGTNGALPASYAMITTMDGPDRESTLVYSTNPAAVPPTLTACFTKAHLVGTTLTMMGAFGNGIVPPVGVANGSTGTVLKMFGDINGDGNMVFVEYTCDPNGTHKLYRNTMAFDAAVKPPLSDALVLLSNVMPNPGGTACFTYQVTDPMTVQGNVVRFVLDVAITLTVQTEKDDPITKQKQTETKALLNVSPRNIFGAWQLASQSYTDRIQSTPATITTLLALPS